MNMRDVIGGAVLAVFFAWMWFWGVRLGVDYEPGQGLAPTAPSLFPYVLSLLGVLFSISMAVGAWKIPASTPSEFSDSASLPLAQVATRASMVLAAFAAYYLLFVPLGALLASILVLGPLLYLGGERRPLWLIGATIGLPLIIQLVFVRLANVPLPRGPLPF